MSDWESSIQQDAVDTAESLGKQLVAARQRIVGLTEVLAALGKDYAALIIAKDRDRLAHGRSVALLRYALHLRQYGERAPGGNETWAEFDRAAEAFLRGYSPVQVPENAGKHPGESTQDGTN
jgi:hypothetical protein